MSKRSPIGADAKSHLNGCADCSRYADQTTALLSLLSAQPRVEAPSDFDFRLRARIAREKAEPRGILAGLEAIWSRSFSWGQAATTVATLALAVTLTTVFIDRKDEIVAPAQDMAQVSTAPVQTAPAEIAVEKSSPVRTEEIRRTVSASRTAVPTAVPVEARRLNPVAAEPGAETLRVYNRERGQVIAASSRTTLIGAEAPAANLARNASYVPSI